MDLAVLADSENVRGVPIVIGLQSVIQALLLARLVSLLELRLNDLHFAVSFEPLIIAAIG